MKRALVAGCGYVGKIVARLFCEAGWQVAGVTRSEESAKSFASEKYRVLACDCSRRDAVEKSLAEFCEADAVVHCASAGGGGADAYRRAYFDVAKNLLRVLRPKQFLFTSSTSVYAQNDGSPVDEKSAAEPERETGKILRETENLVLAHSGVVARLAGIYGPDRWHSLEKFLAGEAMIEGDGSRWLNHIHRDDAAGAIFFLIQKNAGGIFNVTDDTPITQQKFYELLAAHFSKPLPPRGEIDTNRKRGVTNKRVSNAKLRALGWAPRFPSIETALPR